MLTEIGAYDAKTKLPEILRRVSSGEAFTITNRGKPIADLMPSHRTQESKALLAIDNILKMKRIVVSDELLNEMKLDGRK